MNNPSDFADLEPDEGIESEPCQPDDEPKDKGAQWKREVSRYGSASLQSLILARLQQRNRLR